MDVCRRRMTDGRQRGLAPLLFAFALGHRAATTPAHSTVRAALLRRRLLVLRLPALRAVVRPHLLHTHPTLSTCVPFPSSNVSVAFCHSLSQVCGRRDKTVLSFLRLEPLFSHFIYNFLLLLSFGAFGLTRSRAPLHAVSVSLPAARSASLLGCLPGAYSAVARCWFIQVLVLCCLLHMPAGRFCPALTFSWTLYGGHMVKT